MRALKECAFVSTAHINRIVTTVPPHDVHSAFVRYARTLLEDRRAVTVFDRMVDKTQISHRYAVLPPSVDPEGISVDATGVYSRGRFPNTADRMRLYELHAPELAERTVAGLGLGAEARRITHVIVTSCTGMYAPGLDLDLVRRCDLDPSVERTMVCFMGCYAAINALKLARHIVRSEPAARAHPKPRIMLAAPPGDGEPRADAVIPGVRRRLRGQPRQRGSGGPRARRWLHSNAVDTAALTAHAADLSAGTSSLPVFDLSPETSSANLSQEPALLRLPGYAANSPQTLVWVAHDGVLLGVLALADSLRSEAADVVAALRRDGLRVIMLTGDHPQVALAIAAEAGIPAADVIAQVLPGDKADAILELQRGGPVAMVGDGINDAPALARAEVGVAIGTGTDVAIHAADITLMRSDLRALPEALVLSRRTVAIIRQNLLWASIYNLVLIPVAAGVLYPLAAAPAVLRSLHPALAALAMALSSLTVVLNSLRLRRA